MKFLILFYLFHLVYHNAHSKPYSTSREPRNFFNDFLKNWMPVRTTYNQSTCECGLNGLRTGRIVNGTDSDIQPWLAVLFTENSKRHFCSATLINSRFLVTAYHCLIEQTNQTLRILLGTNAISKRQMVEPINFYPNIVPLLNERLTSNNKRSTLELLYRLDENGSKTLLFNPNQLNPFALNNLQIFKPRRLILNREFEKSFFKNDIALIELENDIQFTDYIRPICLLNPSMYLENAENKLSFEGNKLFNQENDKLINKIVQNQFNDENERINLMNDFENEERWLQNKQFSVYGFGRTAYNEAGSLIIKKINLKYESLDKCRSKWTSMLAFWGSLIDETHICASDKYSTICQGDSGTGLILALNSTVTSKSLMNGQIDTTNRIENIPQIKKLKHYLIGIASAGYYCKSDVPSIFTRLSKQLDFIYSNVKTGYWCK